MKLNRIHLGFWISLLAFSPFLCLARDGLNCFVMQEERDQNPGPMPQSLPTLLLWKRDIMDISGKSISRQRTQMVIC